ncbi:arsenate reductase/protein-tyrosine-phosphatase family protein [Streptomyces violascens]|uniref:arsenate reductase/protein-tyrosine-phosphatase family protein n=1 Tax=Streptomyces violascens TaxID=67381 RepID=UPI0019C7FBB0|nr:low molecular weight phosphotyrosine protein phosphatase [Streptomyces violascens]GGU43068.1 hypothetical protein GCM10010289_74880 [Streptomyces violascens]
MSSPPSNKPSTRAESPDDLNRPPAAHPDGVSGQLLPQRVRRPRALSPGGDALEVRSAGLIDKWVGGPAHPNMIKAARARGYDLTSHQPTQVDKTLIDWADLVLAMDRSVLDQLHTIGGEDNTAKLRLYLDDGQDVPDPMGKRAADFADCAAIIEAGAAPYLP